MNSLAIESTSVGGAAPTLLLLDADIRNARVLAGLLVADGYRIEICRNDTEVLIRVAQLPDLDALILVVSPDGQGDLESVRRIHARHPDLSIFLITAHPQLAHPLDPESQGWLRIFVKPLDYCALLRALGKGRPP